MSRTTEAPVLRLLELLGQGDLATHGDEIAGLFAEDAWYEMQVPAPEKIHGRAAILGELQRQAGHYSDLVCEMVTLVSDDRVVVTERIDRFTIPGTGKRVANALSAVFEVGAAGLITAWREYWDMAALTRQMA